IQDRLYRARPEAGDVRAHTEGLQRGLRGTSVNRDAAPSSAPMTSDHLFQRVILFGEVMQQGHADMANDEYEQQPCDGGVEAADSSHPRNLRTFRDQFDAEGSPAMAAAYHGENAGDRHRNHARIEQ